MRSVMSEIYFDCYSTGVFFTTERSTNELVVKKKLVYDRK